MAVVIEPYSKKCKTTLGKIKHAYIFEFVKYNRSQIKSSGMSLTAFPETLIYKFDVEGDFTQNSSDDQGSYFFDQTVNLKLSEVYDILDVHNFLKTDWRIIVETYNNELLIFGVRNGMTAKVSNQSGASKSDFNGFSLAFTGKEEKTALLISSFEDLGFIEIIEGQFLNYDLNFDI